MNFLSKDAALNLYKAYEITIKSMLGIFVVMLLFYITIILLSKFGNKKI